MHIMDDLMEQVNESEKVDYDFVKQMSESEREEIFHILFFEELESCHSTDFFLCDNCIDEFKEKYKGIDLTDITLQTNMMPLEVFHSGTIISSFFSFDECEKYIHIIECPYCSHPLEYNFWPYDLLFDVGKYADDIEEISKIASCTPFLLLSNPFATKTLELIKEIVKTSSYEIIGINVYRSRTTKNPNTILHHNEIGAIPDSLAKEGRFNHSGHGHLYVSTSKEVCIKEIGANQNKSVCTASIKLLKSLKILDLTDIKGFKIDNKLYSVILSSSLIYNSPSDNSWERPEYVFTRFIADSALFAGFDGIKYNSRYSFDGFNYVIFKDKSNKNFNWDSIYMIEDVESIN